MGGTSSFRSKLWWWYYCMDYEIFNTYLGDLLQTYVTEYRAAGGPAIEAEKLRPMVIISAIQQMAGLVSAVPQIMRMCPAKEWSSIQDRYDPRIAVNVDDK